MLDIVTFFKIVLMCALFMITVMVLSRHEELNNNYIQKDSLMDLKEIEKIKCSFCKSDIYFIGKNKTLCPFCNTYN